MFVLKRDGRKEPVMFDKITSRIQKLCYGLDMEFIDPAMVAMKVINCLYSGVTTVELDNVAAEYAISLSDEHPDYAILAARIEISNLHKETKKSFSEVMEDLYNAGKFISAKQSELDEDFINVVRKNEDAFNSALIFDRDFSYSYSGMKILQKRFLKKINGKIVERPQHMHMRIAVAIHGENINAVLDTYDLLSCKFYMHNSAIMKNAGFRKAQYLRGYAVTMKSDSIEGIYDTLTQCGLIARSGGECGLNVSCIRATGTYIAGTNGTSNGLTPMLRVYNSAACYTHQGGEKEVCSMRIYLEPWHADIFDFLALKKSSGKEERRARNLSYGLFIPDLFMRRVENDEQWSLMTPSDSEDLQNLWGKEFEERYTEYEDGGRFIRKVSARRLWFSIVDSQLSTGEPAIMFKDNCNRKNNLKNLGTLNSSSFSGDTMVFSSSEEAPACGSAVISLDRFVLPQRTFDFLKLKESSKVITKTLNRVLDVNYYPVEDTKGVTLKQRPITIGVQGLAETFILMRYPYESEDAKLLNKQIFETIYYGALEASCELAEREEPYEGFKGSPVSEGVLQFDMWNESPSGLHDWSLLREKVMRTGVRNSVLVGCLDDRICANIHGCTKGTEVLGSNYASAEEDSSHKNRKMVNRHLIKDLMERGVWNKELALKIKENEGLLQDIEEIPNDLKQLYKTTWEVPQREVLQMAVSRGPFIDQSQSLEIRLLNPNTGKLTSMHFFAWNSGLKTGMTNLQSKIVSSEVKEKAEEISLVVEKKDEQEVESDDDDGEATNGEEREGMDTLVCSLENRDECLMCGS